MEADEILEFEMKSPECLAELRFQCDSLSALENTDDWGEIKKLFSSEFVSCGTK